MGTAAGVDLTVVIVSYNVADLLRRCLDSVSRTVGTSGLGFEIVVVDNASTDGSGEMLRNEFPGVALLQNDSNRGFASATNQGLEQSKGRYVFLLNPDTELIGDAAGRLIAFMDARPDAGMSTGQLINPDGTLQHGAFRFPSLWMSFLDFFPINHRLTGSRLNGRYRLDGNVPFEIDHPLGASMMVRRAVLDQVGPLDDAFFMYCEEIDWCIRIKKAGWRIFCVPQARIIHHVAQSTRQRAPAMYVELQKSRSLLFRKHYPRSFQWAHRRIVHLGVRREMARLSRRRLSSDQVGAWREAYQKVLGL
ncbi:MAG: glycosyltransferase family 2 protein [Dehalococcoidia bacterium]|nr:glycosyltransferase family 2 protein [Dehalococcoidia bacterium]